MNAMRLNITNRCQYECFYCPYSEKDCQAQEISFAQLMRFCNAAISGGITRFEIAGGEPLLNSGCIDLIESLKAVPSVEWVSLTTNGILLPNYLGQLKKAGIDGINVHLDTTFAQNFHTITQKKDYLNLILEGIWNAVAQDIPVAVTVALHQLSMPTLSTMAGLAKQFPLIVRFTSIGEETEKACLSEENVIEILRHNAPFVSDGNGGYIVEGWKGKVIFSEGIGGAFQMEHAIELGYR